MHVNILDFLTGNKKLLCVVRVVNGVVEVTGECPPGIRHDLDAHRRRKPDERDFLRTLPREFLGGLTQAEFVDD